MRKAGARRVPEPPSKSDFVLPSKANTALKIVPPSLDADKAPLTSGRIEEQSSTFQNGTNSPSPEPSLFIPPQKLGKPKFLDSKASRAPSQKGEPLGEKPIQPSLLTDATSSLTLSPQEHISSSLVNATESLLDIHADNYVPMWLTTINEAPAIPQYCCALNTTNYAAYIAGFAGHRFLSPIPQLRLPPVQTVPVRLKIKPEALVPHLYGQYFSDGLQNEISAQAQNLKALSMFNAAYDIEDLSQQLYRFTVPGLREDSPRVNIGDVVMVRPLTATPQGNIMFSGLEYHAIVWGVSKSKEQMLLRMDGFTPMRSRTCNVIFAVQEHRCAPFWRSIETTASLLNDAPNRPSAWLRSMLFPDDTDAQLQTKLPRGSFDLTWYDSKLNYEQQKAVDAIVQAEYGCVPFLVWGPPGTGKTKTLVETALQLLKSQPSRGLAPHLLICAPSDPAADTLAKRLSANLNPTELFRLNSWTRSFAEVPEQLLPYTSAENDLFSLPGFTKLMSFKVVVTTCRDADMLVQARLTNDALASLAWGTVSAISPAASNMLDAHHFIHWTALLLDEAAQATEPETLVPMLVVQPGINKEVTPQYSIVPPVPQIVMAGDQHQLGPRLSLLSQGAVADIETPQHQQGGCTGEAVNMPVKLHQLPSVLSTSLFARLFARAFYDAHPLSRSRGSKPLKSNMLPIVRPAFTNLVRNYRSHPAILATPSMFFYNDTLIPESRTLSDVVREWPGWRLASSNPGYEFERHESIAAGPGRPQSSTGGRISQSVSSLSWPVLFVQNKSPDALESVLVGNRTGALYNAGEAGVALIMVRKLLEHTTVTGGVEQRIRADEIAIMSPFRAQVNLLRKVFRGAGLHHVNIGPLEAFQGLESRIVMLCTTRRQLDLKSKDRYRFVKEDQARGLGIISEPKRLNVALTRAKEGLIVIGDAETLTCTNDQAWHSFLAFCERNARIVHQFSTADPVEWPKLGTNTQISPNTTKPDRVWDNSQRPIVHQGAQSRLERALRYAQAAKDREKVKHGSDEDEGRELGRGFGYPETRSTKSKNGRLMGNMLSLDEEMWSLGLKAADEAYDEIDDVDDFEGETEEVAESDEDPGTEYGNMVDRSKGQSLVSSAQIVAPLTTNTSSAVETTPGLRSRRGLSSPVGKVGARPANGKMSIWAPLISLSPGSNGHQNGQLIDLLESPMGGTHVAGGGHGSPVSGLGTKTSAKDSVQFGTYESSSPDHNDSRKVIQTTPDGVPQSEPVFDHDPEAEFERANCATQ